MPTDQALRALEEANRVRTGRAQVKRSLRSGQLHLADLLASVPSCLRNCPIEDLLLAARGMGMTKAEQILRRVGITPSQPVGRLTERQKAVILDVVRDEYPRMWRAWGCSAGRARALASPSPARRALNHA